MPHRDTDNPFALLGLPPAFDLDEQALHRAFIAASARTHPDRAVDVEQQVELARQAARINHAYQCLKDPESRARALLDMLGPTDPATEKGLPDGLLEQILDARERMDQAVRDQDRKTLLELQQQADQRRRQTLERISSLFEQALAQPGPADRTLLDQIRILLNGLRYHLRMLEQLQNELEPDPAS